LHTERPAAMLCIFRHAAPHSMHSLRSPAVQHHGAHRCGACPHRWSGPELDAPALLRRYCRQVSGLHDGLRGSHLGVEMNHCNECPWSQPAGHMQQQQQRRQQQHVSRRPTANTNTAFLPLHGHEQVHLGARHAGHQVACAAAAGGSHPAAAPGALLAALASLHLLVGLLSVSIFARRGAGVGLLLRWCLPTQTMLGGLSATTAAAGADRCGRLPLCHTAFQGYQPKRTIYLAFGHDEEVGGSEGG